MIILNCSSFFVYQLLVTVPQIIILTGQRYYAITLSFTNRIILIIYFEINYIFNVKHSFLDNFTLSYLLKYMYLLLILAIMV